MAQKKGGGSTRNGRDSKPKMLGVKAFGGELISPDKNVFKDIAALHVVGIFPDYETAYLAWKAEAQRTVDNAHMRYFIANLHRLRQEEDKGSATEPMTS